jgi:NTP pyrophosphatase (non-canonical NTP hydrolase)
MKLSLTINPFNNLKNKERVKMQIPTITQEQHAQMVTALAKSGAQIAKELADHPLDCHSAHMAMGIAGESGELLDAVKKSVIYRKPLDRDNVIEELGDLEFYMEGLRQGLSITREETLLHNIEKLSIRYNDLKYSDQSAIDRADKAPIEGCDQAPQEE